MDINLEDDDQGGLRLDAPTDGGALMDSDRSEDDPEDASDMEHFLANESDSESEYESASEPGTDSRAPWLPSAW